MKYFYINNIKFKYSSVNKSIIDYCENVGINIPHFCYHKNLSIAGNCRMCLVELKNSPKPLISCAMPISNNMEIYTFSPLVQKARENVMEFLLLNHPLDCPICDQGGECDLQDQSFIFGSYKTRFYNYKRVVTNKNLGIVVKTVMTRCIHCTRCVRFSDEIAGSFELGMFGRGTNSEIGTYVNKIFKSELAGNVIDICPVGALTSKPYPFTSRSWELKTLYSVDYLDSLGSSIQILTKDNTIIKILPSFNNYNFLNYWITDKTRFSFSGMFSPERITDTFLFYEKKLVKKSWKSLFKDIIYNIYFQNHLNQHSYNSFKITLSFHEEISLDLLQLLLLFKKRFFFFSLRTLNYDKRNNHLESSFLLNCFFSDSDSKKKKTNLCFLFNINTRFENYLINLKLKKLYLKGNFKIITFGSLTDLTYPVTYLGSNSKIFKKFIEGTHPYCQTFKQAINPFLFLNSNALKRNDSLFLANSLNFIEKFNLTSLNYINNSITETTINYINSFKKFSFTDYKKSLGFYFINFQYKNSVLKSIIELKLITNYQQVGTKNKVLINQHNTYLTHSLSVLKRSYNSNVFMNLPNKVFFETSELYLNNEGILKKKIKVLNSLTNSKSNWMLLRSLYSHLKLINFGDQKLNEIIQINMLKRKNMLIYLTLIYLPSTITYISKKTLTLNKYFIKNISFVKKFNVNKLKYVNSKLTLWIEDFYIGGKDLYSKFSLILIKCSKEFRKISSNFYHVL